MGLHMVTFILLIVGGLNWLLRVFGWDLEGLGLSMTIDKIIYLLVGLSAIYEIVTHKGRCKECKPDGAAMGGAM